ncbi:hypothetical protein DY000_02053190 [Brassica cretica]|uniref:Uncharacterized protein n=1 Tax=Brassica cretica TaxID=69181 RepID=A0ABQ7A6H0_BRACR|nr:hypothetical protein DY000_02053190 [Brassica cretica]
MPDCMRGYDQSVDRLDRSLVWSLKRLRAVTPSTLSAVFFGLLSCNIPGPAQKETQVLEAQEEETLDITSPTSYKRRSSPRIQPQERQQAKPCRSITSPPPLAAAAPPPTKPAASHPRSPSRRNRAPSRRLLDSVSCKQLRSEP